MVSPGVVNWYDGVRTDTALTLSVGTVFNLFGGTFASNTNLNGEFRSYGDSIFAPGFINVLPSSSVFANSGTRWRGSAFVSAGAIFMMYVRIAVSAIFFWF